MPDELLHRIAKFRLEDPKGDSTAFLKSLLPQVRTAGLSPQQDVALGMAYYFGYMPKESSAILDKYLDHSDALGRVSWEADERMLAAAFQKDEEAEQRIPEFRKRFKPDPEDLLYTDWLVWDAAEYHREKGEYQKAVDLMLADLHELPIDMPYETFEVLGSQYECFKKSGHGQVAIDLMKKHREALLGRLLAAHANVKDLSVSKVTFTRPHKAGVEHFYYWIDGPVEDESDFKREQVILRRSAKAVSQIDDWIKQANAGAETLK